MFQHILVTLDGSPRAERVLPIAAYIARTTGGRITLLRVVTSQFDLDIRPMPLIGHIELSQETEIAQAEQYLAQVSSSDDLKGITIQPEVLTGSPADTILLFTRLQHVDLIIIGSHGLGGHHRWWLGSIAQHIARYSLAPVFIQHEGSPLPIAQFEDSARPLRILVPLDGSPLAEAALVPTVHLCATLAAPGRGSLHLIHVLQPLPEIAGRRDAKRLAEIHEQMYSEMQAYMQAITQHIRETVANQLHLAVTSSIILHPDTADALLQVAEHGDLVEDKEKFNGYDAIAMATHGRGGPQRWVMGSMTERILNSTKLPLLVVRSPTSASGSPCIHA